MAGEKSWNSRSRSDVSRWCKVLSTAEALYYRFARCGLDELCAIYGPLAAPGIRETDPGSAEGEYTVKLVRTPRSLL